MYDKIDICIPGTFFFFTFPSLNSIQNKVQHANSPAPVVLNIKCGINYSLILASNNPNK